MKTIAFFNNKGGVGKTSLVYHLACMYSEMGLRVVAADLDPQANLSAMFLDDDQLEQAWGGDGAGTVMTPILPLLQGVGGIGTPSTVSIDGVHLLVGDLELSGFEDELSAQWSLCLDQKVRAFHVISSFHKVIRMAAEATDADLALIDVGPNLGAINRAALIAADWIVVPLAPDLFSIKGLQNLGPRLRQWRKGWSDRRVRAPEGIDLPEGAMSPAGYVVMQHAVRLDRPVKAYDRWMRLIPDTFRNDVLGREPIPESAETADDRDCLALLKHYRSLMPLAQNARKPMFRLRAADGAIGSHAQAVKDCYQDFMSLAKRVDGRTSGSLNHPDTP